LRKSNFLQEHERVWLGTGGRFLSKQESDKWICSTGSDLAPRHTETQAPGSIVNTHICLTHLAPPHTETQAPGSIVNTHICLTHALPASNLSSRDTTHMARFRILRDQAHLRILQSWEDATYELEMKQVNDMSPVLRRRIVRCVFNSSQERDRRMKMDAAFFSETLIKICQTTGCRILEDRNLDSHGLRKLKPHR
jgi:hypothetical protein